MIVFRAVLWAPFTWMHTLSSAPPGCSMLQTGARSLHEPSEAVVPQGSAVGAVSASTPVDLELDTSDVQGQVQLATTAFIQSLYWLAADAWTLIADAGTLLADLWSTMQLGWDVLDAVWRTASEAEWITRMCYGLLAFGAVSMVLLLFINAPYGRHTSTSKLGLCSVPARVMWVLMELPNLLVAATCIWFGKPDNLRSPVNMVLLSMFVIHYLNRTLVYPFRLAKSSTPGSITTLLSAACFCSCNAFVQCATLTRHHVYSMEDLETAHVLFGLVIWFTGLCINIHSDTILINLRKRKPKAGAKKGAGGKAQRYFIPRGGLFEYVSGANYLGEWIEWAGYALAVWNLPGLTFVLFTICNTGPRALSNHQWYLRKFDDYPKHRRAVVPGLI